MTFTTWGELHGPPYRGCRCNLCGATFSEKDILIEDDKEIEHCPECFEKGYIIDMGEED